MDRTGKLLLAVIALGIWANIAVTHVRPAKADTEDWLGKIALELQSISHNVDVLVTSGLGCTNPKLCR